MQRILVAVLLTLCLSGPAAAQSLFVRQGERAADASVAWSVGPFSNGVETSAAVTLNGRLDLGFGVNWYAADFGGEDDTTFIEWAPFVRYFLFKEQDHETPVSFAAHGVFVKDELEGDDSAWYALLGAQLYKRLDVTERLGFHPFVGFSLAAESYSFGGGEAEHAVYLTRQFGVHTLLALTNSTWLRITAEEQGFRRETYRAARVAVVRRF